MIFLRIFIRGVSVLLLILNRFNCILFQDIDGLVGSELGSLATASVTPRSADMVRTATASLQASLREILASNTKVLKPDHPALVT